MEDVAPCICGRLRRASRTLTRAYDEALEPVGLTVTQFSVLRTIARMGEPSLTALADTTAHEKSGLWRLLQPLIRSGMVASRVERRVQHLRLTEAGAQALERARPHWTQAQARVAALLGPRSDELVRLLSEVETLV